MRVSDDPELAGWLSPSEVEAFVARLGLQAARPDLPALRRLLRAYLSKIPFQNVGMLARSGRAPMRAEILDDMRRGRGGPCNVMNPFFAALLSGLGYEVSLLSGSMAAPDCHIALTVEAEGRSYWVDAGNGHPYLEPVAFGDGAPRAHAGLTYRLAPRGDATFAVEHRFPGATEWKTSYILERTPRPLGFFARMIEQHHTEPGFGPFLTGLRIVRFPGGALTAIRDAVLLTGRAGRSRTPIADRRALLDIVAAHFGDVDLPVDEAIRALERAGRPLFGASP
jgi:N-hydroxyarylamine O-acetyltransferase